MVPRATICVMVNRGEEWCAHLDVASVIGAEHGGHQSQQQVVTKVKTCVMFHR